MDSELRHDLLVFHLALVGTAPDLVTEVSAATIAFVLSLYDKLEDMIMILERAPQTEMISGFVAVLKEMEENHNGNN